MTYECLGCDEDINPKRDEYAHLPGKGEVHLECLDKLDGDGEVWN